MSRPESSVVPPPSPQGRHASDHASPQRTAAGDFEALVARAEPALGLDDRPLCAAGRSDAGAALLLAGLAVGGPEVRSLQVAPPAAPGAARGPALPARATIPTPPVIVPDAGAGTLTLEVEHPAWGRVTVASQAGRDRDRVALTFDPARAGGVDALRRAIEDGLREAAGRPVDVTLRERAAG